MYIRHMATKILFISTLILSTYYPIEYLYQSEGLNNSLLNNSKVTLYSYTKLIGYTDASQ